MKKPDFSCFAKKFNDLKCYVWNKSNDSGNIFIYAGVAGYFSSMIAQVYNVLSNEKLDKKDKNYMLPQEISEGITNVILTYLIGKGLKNLGDWYMEEGRKPIEEYRKVFDYFIDTKGKNFKEIVNKGIGYIDNLKNGFEFPIDNTNQGNKLSFVLDNFYRFVRKIENKDLQENILKPFNKKELLILLRNTIDDFEGLKSGMRFLTTLAASILVFCGIAPIVRNKIAGKFSEHAEVKNQENMAKMLKHSTPIYVQRFNFAGAHPLKFTDKTKI